MPQKPKIVKPWAYRSIPTTSSRNFVTTPSVPSEEMKKKASGTPPNCEATAAKAVTTVRSARGAAGWSAK